MGRYKKTLLSEFKASFCVVTSKCLFYSPIFFPFIHETYSIRILKLNLHGNKGLAACEPLPLRRNNDLHFKGAGFSALRSATKLLWASFADVLGAQVSLTRASIDLGYYFNSSHCY